jgi:hypothetical protein
MSIVSISLLTGSPLAVRFKYLMRLPTELRLTIYEMSMAESVLIMWELVSVNIFPLRYLKSSVHGDRIHPILHVCYEAADYEVFERLLKRVPMGGSFMEEKRHEQVPLLIPVKVDDMMHLGPIHSGFHVPPCELALPAVIGASCCGINAVVIQLRNLAINCKTYGSIMSNYPALEDIYALTEEGQDVKGFHASWARNEVGELRRRSNDRDGRLAVVSAYYLIPCLHRTQDTLGLLYRNLGRVGYISPRRHRVHQIWGVYSKHPVHLEFHQPSQLGL